MPSRRPDDTDQVARDTHDLYDGRTSGAALKASAAWNRMMRRLIRAAEDEARERASKEGTA